MEEAVEYIEYLYNKELNEEKSSEKLAGELQNLSEGDLSNYLQQLENYEDLLARGKILWK